MYEKWDRWHQSTTLYFGRELTEVGIDYDNLIEIIVFFVYQKSIELKSVDRITVYIYLVATVSQTH